MVIHGLRTIMVIYASNIVLLKYSKSEKLILIDIFLFKNFYSGAKFLNIFTF